MTATEQRPIEFMRADAARNVQRILDVAARLFGEDPHAGMADVACAADVSRATVYRHFATREALMSALRLQAVECSERALVQCRLEEGSATDALRRLVCAWLDVAERYAFLQLTGPAQPSAATAARERQRRVLGEPLLALIRRGQAAGEFSAALSAEWANRVFVALLLAGARAINDATMSRAAAPEIVFHTLLDGLRA